MTDDLRNTLHVKIARHISADPTISVDDAEWERNNLIDAMIAIIRPDVLREAAEVAFEESSGYPRQDPGDIAAAILALAETGGDDG